LPSKLEALVAHGWIEPQGVQPVKSKLWLVAATLQWWNRNLERATSRNRLKGQGFVELVLKVGKNDKP
jgi:hypothetical protein